jgi:hypothetical protein
MNKYNFPSPQGGGEIAKWFATCVVFAFLFFQTPSSFAAEQTKTVRDWTGACDEYSCTADVTGEGGLASGGTGYRLRIARANEGGGGWTVTLIAHNVPKPGEGDSVTVEIPGATVPVSTVTKLDEDKLGFSDQAALEQIFPALRKGANVKLTFTADGAAHSESFSLSGLAAVLLWMDEKQGKVGQSQTVAAYGGEKAIAKLEGKEASVFKNEIEALSPVSQCQWNEEGGDASLYQVERYDLGEGKTLYGVLCWRGAYQESFVFFVGDGQELKVQAFADYSEDLGWSGTLELTMPHFDEKTKTLGTHTKFRGVGDCGSSAVYEWTQSGFKLMQYNYKGCSDEITENSEEEWPAIYKAKE